MHLHGQYMPLNDGFRLHVITAGTEDNPPLLMLHCWTGNWTQWERTMTRLGENFRYIVPDHLGFGGSDKPIGDHYQIDAQANRTYQIVRDLGYDKVSIIGHSMGGMIGLTFAGMYPDMVDKLIVVSGAVTGKLHPSANSLSQLTDLGRYGIVEPMRLLVSLGRLIPVVGKKSLETFFANPDDYQEAGEYWGSQIVRDGQEYTSPWAGHATTQWDTRPLLPNIKAKTLAIWGEQDYLIPVSESDVLKEAVSDIEVLRIPNVGHFPMIEAWDTYSNALSEFLS